MKVINVRRMPLAVAGGFDHPAGVVKDAAVTSLAFTGAETVPLGLYGLFTLVLGAVLTVASRRQSAKRARE